MKYCSAMVVAAALTLGGCGGNPDRPRANSAQPPKLVAIGNVINALKCELAETFKDNAYVATLLKEQTDENGQPTGFAKIDATLTLSNTLATGVKGSGGLEIEAFGATLGGSGSRGRDVTRSNDIGFDFSFAAKDGMAVPAFCQTLDQKVRIEGDPFVEILNGISAEYDRIERAEPKVKFGPLSFTSKFDVKRSSEAGVEFALLIFKIGATRTTAFSESQTLKLKFDIDKLPALTPP